MSYGGSNGLAFVESSTDIITIPAVPAHSSDFAKPPRHEHTTMASESLPTPATRSEFAVGRLLSFELTDGALSLSPAGRVCSTAIAAIGVHGSAVRAGAGTPHVDPCGLQTSNIPC